MSQLIFGVLVFIKFISMHASAQDGVRGGQDDCALVRIALQLNNGKSAAKLSFYSADERLRLAQELNNMDEQILKNCMTLMIFTDSNDPYMNTDTSQPVR